MELASLSANLLFVSFIAYLVATLFFGGAVKGAKSEASYKNNRWGKIAIVITIIGFLTHLGYFITRWMASGHAPVSNMFEFTTAFGMMLVGAFILLFFLYRTPSLGLVCTADCDYYYRLCKYVPKGNYTTYSGTEKLLAMGSCHYSCTW